jgi:hypothetical protein
MQSIARLVAAHDLDVLIFAECFIPHAFGVVHGAEGRGWGTGDEEVSGCR